MAHLERPEARLPHIALLGVRNIIGVSRLQVCRYLLPWSVQGQWSFTGPDIEQFLEAPDQPYERKVIMRRFCLFRHKENG